MPLPSAEFHRFAVAYGLSCPISKLPEMVFPMDVKKKAEFKKRRDDYGAMYEKWPANRIGGFTVLTVAKRTRLKKRKYR